MSVLLVMASVPEVLFGQYQNVWIFGDQAGLDFNTEPPAPFRAVNSIAPYDPPHEASASVCDAQGALLFYTDGSFVFDRQQNLMPGGANLTGMSMLYNNRLSATASTAQGALILPYPGNPERYFIFSLTSKEFGDSSGRLYYSVIDLTLNGGMGDVVPGSGGILADTGLTEMMTAAAGYCNGFYQVLVLNAHKNEIKAFRVDENGVHGNPVLSSFGAMPGNDGGGYMSVSSNQKQLAVSCAHGGSKGLYLFDLDVAAGTAKNPLKLDTAGSAGLCFSPDNSKLYSVTGKELAQFNLHAGQLQDIIDSRQVLLNWQNYQGSFPFHIQAGPDGKLYFRGANPQISNTHPYLSVLHRPNLAGTAAGLEINYISFATLGAAPRIGLPAALPVAPATHLAYVHEPQEACAFRIRITARDTSGTNYRWSDGFRTPSREALQSGIYWVSYDTRCGSHSDTFRVQLYHPAGQSITRVVCRGDVYDFNGKELTEPGVYRDTFKTKEGCDSVVTLYLTILPKSEITLSFIMPERLCMLDTLQLSATGSYRYSWFTNGRPVPGTGGQGVSASVVMDRAVNEILLVGISENECKDTLRREIPAEPCCNLYIPSAFSPNGDGLNDGFGVLTPGHLSNFVMSIFNRWGDRIYQGLSPQDRWDGSYKGSPAEPGVYFYQAQADCPDGGKVRKQGDLMLVR